MTSQIQSFSVQVNESQLGPGIYIYLLSLVVKIKLYNNMQQPRERISLSDGGEGGR